VRELVFGCRLLATPPPPARYRPRRPRPRRPSRAAAVIPPCPFTPTAQPTHVQPDGQNRPEQGLDGRHVPMLQRRVREVPSGGLCRARHGGVWAAGLVARSPVARRVRRRAPPPPLFFFSCFSLGLDRNRPYPRTHTLITSPPTPEPPPAVLTSCIPRTGGEKTKERERGNKVAGEPKITRSVLETGGRGERSPPPPSPHPRSRPALLLSDPVSHARDPSRPTPRSRATFAWSRSPQRPPQRPTRARARE
jgi:hypothetical protein